MQPSILPTTRKILKPHRRSGRIYSENCITLIHHWRIALPSYTSARRPYKHSESSNA